MKTNATRSNIKSVAHNPNKKGNFPEIRFQGAFLDVEKEKLIVTNKHVLVEYRVTDCENDQNGIIPVESFVTDKKKVDRAEYFVSSDTCQTSIENGKTVENNRLIETTFPEIERLYPQDGTMLRIGFSREQLKNLLNAIPEGFTDTIKFDIKDNKKAVEFYVENFNLDDEIHGLIMPII